MGIKVYGLAAAGLLVLNAQVSAQPTIDANLALAPAEPALDSFLAKADASALAQAAEQGDLAAGYLLFVLHQREGAGSTAAQRWLAKFASTNTPSARYAYALAKYRSETGAQDKGIEVIDAAAPLSGAERQRVIGSLEAIAPQFPKAYTLLTQIYRDGAWAPADPAKADAYLQRGAAAGAASALLLAAQAISGKAGAAVEAAKLADAATAAGERRGEVLACGAYVELRKSAEALDRCKLAADRGSAWAQLVTGELLATDLAKNRDTAVRYLRLAAQAGDTTIGDRAALRLAAISLATSSDAPTITSLEPAAARNALAAWAIGRFYLDQQADAQSAEKWLTKALALGGSDQAAISYDLARAVRAKGGDWLPSLRQAADKGHPQAALVAAFELQSKSAADARRYAELAATDPAFKARAQELIAYLDGSPG